MASPLDLSAALFSDPMLPPSPHLLRDSDSSGSSSSEEICRRMAAVIAQVRSGLAEYTRLLQSAGDGVDRSEPRLVWSAGWPTHLLLDSLVAEPAQGALSPAAASPFEEWSEVLSGGGRRCCNRAHSLSDLGLLAEGEPPCKRSPSAASLNLLEDAAWEMDPTGISCIDASYLSGGAPATAPATTVALPPVETGTDSNEPRPFGMAASERLPLAAINSDTHHTAGPLPRKQAVDRAPVIKREREEETAADAATAAAAAAAEGAPPPSSRSPVKAEEPWPCSLAAEPTPAMRPSASAPLPPPLAPPLSLPFIVPSPKATIEGNARLLFPAQANVLMVDKEAQKKQGLSVHVTLPRGASCRGQWLSLGATLEYLPPAAWGVDCCAALAAWSVRAQLQDGGAPDAADLYFDLSRLLVLLREESRRHSGYAQEGHLVLALGGREGACQRWHMPVKCYSRSGFNKKGRTINMGGRGGRGGALAAAQSRYFVEGLPY